MNRIKIVAVCIFLASLISNCNEEPPTGLFTVPAKPLLDTTYTTTNIPAAQTKKVMIFDITGVRCVNCPKAAELAVQISNNNPGRVQIIALYADIPGLSQLVDSWENYPKVNSIYSTELVAKIGSPQSLPTGSIDQVSNAGSKLIPIANWAGLVTNRLALSTPANIDINASFDANTNTIRVNSTTTFTSTTNDSFAVFVSLIEDDIESKQSDNRVSSGHIDNYIHKHVLRHLYTDATGSYIKSAGNINPGFTAVKEYQTQKAGVWNIANMHAVVWLVSRSSGEIVHVQSAAVQ